jgi:hypothetical protein
MILCGCYPERCREEVAPQDGNDRIVDVPYRRVVGDAAAFMWATGSSIHP